MRKRIINPTLDTAASNQAWLNLETTASVELTSEDNAFPIESALSRKGKQGHIPTISGWPAEVRAPLRPGRFCPETYLSRQV